MNIFKFHNKISYNVWKKTRYPLFSFKKSLTEDLKFKTILIK